MVVFHEVMSSNSQKNHLILNLKIDFRELGTSNVLDKVEINNY